MDVEKKWSWTKLLVLPIIVFLVMQYQIDQLKAEQAAMHYHNALEGIQRDIYDLEKQMYIEFQRLNQEEVNDDFIIVPTPDAGIDIRG